MPRQFFIVMQQHAERGQQIADDAALQNMFRNGDPSLSVREVYFPTLNQVEDVIRGWAIYGNQNLGVHVEMVSPTQWNILGYQQYAHPFREVRYATPIPFNPNIRFGHASMAEISNGVAGWDDNTIANAQRNNAERFNQQRRRGQIHYTPVLNQAQSTHTASVHQSVTESLRKLDNEYGKKLDIDKQIKKLGDFVEKINRKEFPDIPEHQLAAAVRCIARIYQLYEDKEAGSNITIKKILALLWVAMHDVKKTKDAEEAFIKALYEIQRGYNLNARGVDNMEAEDHPICVGGTINKLVASLNGVHKSVNIVFVTKESAGYKVMGITRDSILEYAKQSENPQKTLGEILTSIEKEGGIPKEFWDKIKDKVAAKMNDEFGGFLNKAVIDSLASEGEYTNFDKGQQERMLKELSQNLPSSKLSATSPTENIQTQTTKSEIKPPPIPQSTTPHTTRVKEINPPPAPISVTPQTTVTSELKPPPAPTNNDTEPRGVPHLGFAPPNRPRAFNVERPPAPRVESVEPSSQGIGSTPNINITAEDIESLMKVSKDLFLKAIRTPVSDKSQIISDFRDKGILANNTKLDSNLLNKLKALRDSGYEGPALEAFKNDQNFIMLYTYNQLLQEQISARYDIRGHDQSPISQYIEEGKITDLTVKAACLFRGGLDDKDQLNILIDIEKHGGKWEKDQAKYFWNINAYRQVSKEQFEDYKKMLNTFLTRVYDIVKNKNENEPNSFKAFRDCIHNDKLSLSEKLFALKSIASEPSNLSIQNNTILNRNLCNLIKNIDFIENRENLVTNMDRLKSYKEEYKNTLQSIKKFSGPSAPRFE